MRAVAIAAAALAGCSGGTPPVHHPQPPVPADAAVASETTPPAAAPRDAVAPPSDAALRVDLQLEQPAGKGYALDVLFHAVRDGLAAHCLAGGPARAPFRIEVDGEGRVTSLELELAEGRECLESAIRELQFPRDATRYTLSGVLVVSWR